MLHKFFLRRYCDMCSSVDTAADFLSYMADIVVLGDLVYAMVTDV